MDKKYCVKIVNEETNEVNYAIKPTLLDRFREVAPLIIFKKHEMLDYIQCDELIEKIELCKNEYAIPCSIGVEEEKNIMSMWMEKCFEYDLVEILSKFQYPQCDKVQITIDTEKNLVELSYKCPYTLEEKVIKRNITDIK